MNNKKALPKTTQTQIDKCVKWFEEERHLFEHLSKILYDLLTTHKKLEPLVHSLKIRVKESDHLRSKLERKAHSAIEKGEKFDITLHNLFDRVEDLTGVRILHLYTDQVRDIDEALKYIFNEQNYEIVEGPIANTWDPEYADFFSGLGMIINKRKTLYTSIHYVIKVGNNIKAEVQVRTLQEEVWGEVSHAVNYPFETGSVACQEQIKVLARLTSSGTRLVDSIFKSKQEYTNLNNSGKNKKPKTNTKLQNRARRA